jgi:tetratricopeptide (TPR) repeat protein
MSWWTPLWSPPDEAAIRAGSSAVAKAQAIGTKSDREAGYIAAIAAFYRDTATLDHRTRSLAYAKAMERMYRTYPDDREAAVFYALALDATAPAADKSYANQKTAAEILQKVFAEQPNHPGVAHYLIHSYDSASLAALGLPAAMCYAQIAPSVPHALHMPSHIFTRLGKWQESIDTNRKSVDTAQAYALRQFGEGVVLAESMHAMDYLEYAYLQLAQDRAARKVIDDMTRFRETAPQMTSGFAMAAMPARYAIERRDWTAAATVSVPTIAFPWERFPWTTAMISFARALGEARTGDFAGAETDIDNLRAARDALREKNKYWSDQVAVQHLEAVAILAHAEGKDEEALAGMRKAVDLEASMDKHPVTPGAIVPSRELLADLLLELNQPAEALAAYEQTLTTEPNRFRSVYGAAKAAEGTGDAAKARSYYQQLADLGSHADTDRPELVEARARLQP